MMEPMVPRSCDLRHETREAPSFAAINPQARLRLPSNALQEIPISGALVLLTERITLCYTHSLTGVTLSTSAAIIFTLMRRSL